MISTCHCSCYFTWNNWHQPAWSVQELEQMRHMFNSEASQNRPSWLADTADAKLSRCGADDFQSPWRNLDDFSWSPTHGTAAGSAVFLGISQCRSKHLSLGFWRKQWNSAYLAQTGTQGGDRTSNDFHSVVALSTVHFRSKAALETCHGSWW